MVSVLILSWKLWRKLDGGNGGLDEGYWNAKLQRLAPTASMGSSFTPDKIVNAASHLSVLEIAMKDRASKVSAPPRPTITLPPRSSIDTLFTGVVGLSPGPLTLVSNFFSETYADSGCRSFSQLLAAAIASPVAATKMPSSFLADNSPKEVNSESGWDRNLGFKQNRPVNLVLAHSPMFMIPPVSSPGFLNSPAFFSPLQSPFGMTHQQALAQVTAQAALSQSYMHVQAENQPSSLAASAESLSHHQSRASKTTIQQKVHSVISEPESSIMESSEVSQSDGKSLPPVAVDKSANDGYNWRKYGQKQVKASEYPRSYYKCTHLNCPAKKKVERNLDGQIIEIIYNGHHNHELPHSNKLAKDTIDMNPRLDSRVRSELGLQGETEMNRPNEPASSDCVETSDETRLDEENNDEPNPKKRQYRNTEVGTSAPTSSHRMVTKPRNVVKTKSEVDHLDDGYKWRKYGQKMVKGNPHPRCLVGPVTGVPYTSPRVVPFVLVIRFPFPFLMYAVVQEGDWSYYKCTSAGCNVRKHVERASTDPKAVVTTYEGEHNHDIPAARKGLVTTQQIVMH
ncbi:hypothetical protein TEA_003989 [Camellia sinensis var. sinensis]|uniref:WRKY domain-containing protein n=1 Tax=Camellia sinensis var. sinensis TaxID=542762 RepID=A0A4S4DE47_CAMSN|nr:hypothetical protein TEA_003989 [Camellia sinensis var. sinensis]